jgi:hypothetical protein
MVNFLPNEYLANLLKKNVIEYQNKYFSSKKQSLMPIHASGKYVILPIEPNV